MASANNQKVFEKFQKFIVDVKTEKAPAAVDEMLIAIQGYSTANVPVDTSNLANSVYRKLNSSVSGVGGMVYYTASYAPYVHEASGKLAGQPRKTKGAVGNYWDGFGRQQVGPKFLELAVDEMIRMDFKRIVEKYS